MHLQAVLPPLWGYLLVLLSYCGIEAIITKKLIRKYVDLPLVGSPSTWTPRIVLNLIFAHKAARVLAEGYRKFKTGSFQLIRNDGSVVILPTHLLDELSALPTTIASPHAALEHDLLGPYTGLNLILQSRLHHSIVQRKLTPRLGLLTPSLEAELNSAVEDYFPACDDWTEFKPYQLFGKISARLSGKALVGPALCRDPTWLNISINYTENLFRTIVVLRLFPSWTHPFLCRALPSYWSGLRHVRQAKALLGPKIRELLHKKDNNTWSSGVNNEDSNVLCWLADTAKGRDRDPHTLAHVEVLLALASVHTTLLRMVNVLYDLTANPRYFEELQGEIREVSDSPQGWKELPYGKLHKLDSVLRESQRMSPPTTLGMKRLFKQSHTFSDGTRITEGTYACLPTFAIENDPQHTTNPEVFDGLRSYRLRQSGQVDGSRRKARDDEYQFHSTGRTVLNFGYGKSACPGRYFASLIVKMLFVKLLTEYEFKFLSGDKRPGNLMAHEFLFCWPWQKMLIRQRKEAIRPF